MATAFCCFGDQLFPPAALGAMHGLPVLMMESEELCRHGRYHQQKLVLQLAAMRRHAELLRRSGFTVLYRPLEKDDGQPHAQALCAFAHAHGIDHLRTYSLHDRFAAESLAQAADGAGLVFDQLNQTPGFCTPLAEGGRWISAAKRLHLADFWKWQRQRMDLLLEPDGSPLGGRWSFDSENRQQLPASVPIPDLRRHTPDDLEREVMALVAERFADHPGSVEGFTWATTRHRARSVWRQFLDQRFAGFGAYQDALTGRNDFVFHSVISPYLNMGLLTPDEILADAIGAFESGSIPLAAAEGFARQVAGWREFVFLVYRHHGHRQATSNHFSAHRRLAPCWWEGNSGLPPLDGLIDKLNRHAYGHHIERLMVAGNLMLLCGVEPQAAHDWFMAMFIDSADWVMGPNVYGMALHSDGGLMTTKPYACGSNYLMKMGDYPRGDWCERLNGLYWNFIAEHASEFSRNHRMVQMVRSWELMRPERKQRLRALGRGLRDDLTRLP